MDTRYFSVARPTLTALEGVTFAANKGLYATGADAFATYDLTAGGRALGGVAGTANTFPYFSASNVVTLGSLTTAGRALLDDADNTAQRTTLGLGTIATQAASAIAVTGGTLYGLGGVQITGSTPTAAGSGLELSGGASASVQAYNRTGGAYIALNVDALTVNLRPAGVSRCLANANGIDVGGSVKPASYTVATVPSASTHGAGAVIYVSNESGGAVSAFSDGTNWRRVTDRAIVS